MTQQSYPNKSEEVVASGASTSSNSSNTLSTDVYPLPFSLGQKEVVWNNEERALVPNDNNVLTSGANICVNDSNDVTIGNHTFFNGDVTIYQNIQNTNLRELPNVRDEVECNKNDRLNNERANQKFIHKWRHFFIPFTLLLLLLLILASLYVFRDAIFNRPPSFPPTNPETEKFIEGHPVYLKANWGALPLKGSPPLLPIPTSLVIISHSATLSCTNFMDCANQTQHIQYNFLKAGHKDIGYNFLIGGEGGIYEGRGWKNENSLRTKSVAISFIGDFNKEFLSSGAISAAKALLKEGMEIGMLSEDYKLIGENQTSPLRFYSPGWNTVKEIKTWEHYFPGSML